MSLTPIILIILTFIVNFIMDFSFWSIMLSLAYMGGMSTAGSASDLDLLVKLSLASVLIPGILAEIGPFEKDFRLLPGRAEGLRRRCHASGRGAS